MTHFDGDLRQQPGYSRFKVGKFRAIAIHDGINIRERPERFVRNVDEEDVARAFRAIGMPEHVLMATYTALALEVDDKLVLFDTGNGHSGPPTAGRLLSNLEAAGYCASDVKAVMISHFHGDHISGLVDPEDKPAFPNAQVFVPQPEWDFWMSRENKAAASATLQRAFELSDRIFRLIGDRTTRFAWGEQPIPGITALQADGHTPGHTVFEIESEGERLLFVADLTNNPLVFARNPEWQGVFDVLPDRAVETRKRVLKRAVEQKLRLFFYHAPFPSNGYMVASSNEYFFLPAFWGLGD